MSLFDEATTLVCSKYSEENKTLQIKNSAEEREGGRCSVQKSVAMKLSEHESEPHLAEQWNERGIGGKWRSYVAWNQVFRHDSTARDNTRKADILAAMPSLWIKPASVG